MDRLDPNTGHAQIVELVGEGRNVLVVGSGLDPLGRALRELGCTVAGVERDSEAAATAATVLDDVRVGDVGTTSLAEIFGGAAFDVIVLSDLLGRVSDPQTLLEDAKALLAPQGRIVISVPNAVHGSRRLALLQGSWPWSGNVPGRGLSRQGLVDLLDLAGLQADELRGTVADPLRVPPDVDDKELPAGVVEWVRNQPDALIHEIQVAATPVADGREPVHILRLIPAVNVDDVRCRDQHTDAAVEAARESLRMKDHVLGLQAEATTARTRFRREADRRRRLQGRLAKQRKELERLRRRNAVLEQRGFVGFLRKVKRKLSN
jgi:SAM-dependent methyltransferase